MEISAIGGTALVRSDCEFRNQRGKRENKNHREANAGRTSHETPPGNSELHQVSPGTPGRAAQSILNRFNGEVSHYFVKRKTEEKRGNPGKDALGGGRTLTLGQVKSRAAGEIDFRSGGGCSGRHFERPRRSACILTHVLRGRRTDHSVG